MIDIKEFSDWLNLLFAARVIYQGLFLVNVCFNIGIFSVCFFNFLAYRKEYSIFFLILSATITFNYIIFLLYTLGLLNIQVYYLSRQYDILIGCLFVYFFLLKLLKLPYSRFFVLVWFSSFFLATYISFLHPSLPATHFKQLINLALEMMIFIFFIRLGYKEYEQSAVERMFFIITIFLAITIFITDFPPIFEKKFPNILYPMKFISLFIVTIIHTYLIGYLTARVDRKFTVEQNQRLKFANQDYNFLLNQKKILEQKVAERTLELQKTTTLKDKLFVTIGHDLRNTIVILKTSLNIFDSKKQHNNTQQLWEQVDDLCNTLDNLLEWSMVQLHRNKVSFKIISIKNNLEDRLEALDYSLREKNIKVTMFLETAYVYANDHQLAIILRNVLSNAVKFTPMNGFINISIKPNNEYIEVIISDSGIGIPPNLLRILFDSNFFYSRVGTAGEKGTGLGLKLCKELIEGHGGTLEIESQVNKGTMVKIRFLA